MHALWKEERTVSNNLTLQYDQVLFILEPNEVTRPLARKRVMVFDDPDCRLAIKHNGRELPYRTFDRRQQVGEGLLFQQRGVPVGQPFCLAKCPA